MAFGASMRSEYECAWLDQVYSLQLIRFTHAGQLLVSTRHFYVYPRTTPKTDQKTTTTTEKIKASNSSHTHWITYPNNNDRTNFMRIKSRTKKNNRFNHVRVILKKQLYKRISRLVSSRRKNHVAALLLNLLCLFAFSFRLDIRHIFVVRVFFFILFARRSCNRDREFFSVSLFIFFTLRSFHHRTDANTAHSNPIHFVQETIRLDEKWPEIMLSALFVHFDVFFCWWHNFNYCICDCSLWLFLRTFHKSWFNLENVIIFCWLSGGGVAAVVYVNQK